MMKTIYYRDILNALLFKRRDYMYTRLNRHSYHHNLQYRHRYSLKKLSVGLLSVAIGTTVFLTHGDMVQAAEEATSDTTDITAGDSEEAISVHHTTEINHDPIEHASDEVSSPQKDSKTNHSTETTAELVNEPQSIEESTEVNPTTENQEKTNDHVLETEVENHSDPIQSSQTTSDHTNLTEEELEELKQNPYREKIKTNELYHKDAIEISKEKNNKQSLDLSGDLKTFQGIRNNTLYFEYKPKETQGLHNIFSVSSSSQVNEYYSILQKDGHIQIEARDSDGNQLYQVFKGKTNLIKPNVWHGISLSIDSKKNKVSLSINGVTQETASHAAGFHSLETADRAHIGAIHRGSNDPQWQGTFDIRDFTVYDRVLTEDELKHRTALLKQEAHPGEQLRENMVATKPQTVFESGKNDQKNEDGIFSYRIPALLVTDKGTVIAGGDERRNHYKDYGDIAMVVRRSEDKGDSWSDRITITDLRRNPNAENAEVNGPFLIDMALVQHPETGRIFAVYDLFPEVNGLWGTAKEHEPLSKEINGKHYRTLYDTNQVDLENPYTIRENGVIYTPEGEPTDYNVVVNPTEKHYKDYGNIIKDGEVVGNIFFITNKTSPFRVSKTIHTYVSHSDDDGKTWSAPRDITRQVSNPAFNFHGIGPGSGIVLKHGKHKGRIVVPTYTTNWHGGISSSQSSRVIYSDDMGETWHVGNAVNDARVLNDGTEIHSTTMQNREAQNTEASVIELNNGHLLLFMRNLSGHVQMARSTDGGVTWGEITTFNDVPDVYVQMSAIQTMYKGKEYVLLANANGPKRYNGYIRIAEVNDDGSLNWIRHKPIHEGKFAYNSLKELSEGVFGILYETADQNHNDYQLKYRRFNFEYLMEDTTPTVNIASIKRLDSKHFSITFNKNIVASNQTTLALDNYGKAYFVAQKSPREVIFKTNTDNWGATITGLSSGELTNAHGFETIFNQKLVDTTIKGHFKLMVDFDGEKVIYDQKDPGVWQSPELAREVYDQYLPEVIERGGKEYKRVEITFTQLDDEAVLTYVYKLNVTTPTPEPQPEAKPDNDKEQAPQSEEQYAGDYVFKLTLDGELSTETLTFASRDKALDFVATLNRLYKAAGYQLINQDNGLPGEYKVTLSFEKIIDKQPDITPEPAPEPDKPSEEPGVEEELVPEPESPGTEAENQQPDESEETPQSEQPAEPEETPEAKPDTVEALFAFTNAEDAVHRGSLDEFSSLEQAERRIRQYANELGYTLQNFRLDNGAFLAEVDADFSQPLPEPEQSEETPAPKAEASFEFTLENGSVHRGSLGKFTSLEQAERRIRHFANEQGYTLLNLHIEDGKFVATVKE
ncbi:YSIRK-type signal peptide-containing protein [Dolosigranulum pigrum]|nr:YSIRK-type signal peptide-containing protein [Dolosigranulum pigrum]